MSDTIDFPPMNLVTISQIISRPNQIRVPGVRQSRHFSGAVLFESRYAMGNEGARANSVLGEPSCVTPGHQDFRTRLVEKLADAKL